jgi:hypothetical protein
MSTWLITSFGLPVVLTVGRLSALTLSGWPRHLVAAGVGTLAAAMTTSLLVARRRRRRASPGASNF